MRVQDERELEREKRAELAEQRRAEKELAAERERLAKQLEKEQAHYANVKAMLEASGDFAGIKRIEARLADVQRAIDDVDYRAANIRAGFVYVISNLGSFGESMVKIGMTRRLEPMDRVRELGDASVPFSSTSTRCSFQTTRWQWNQACIRLSLLTGSTRSTRERSSSTRHRKKCWTC